MSAEHSDGFAGLHKQRLVVLQFTQRPHDCIECFPVSRGPPCSAVNDQAVGVLRHLRVEIVHQHPERGFLMPAFATLFVSARRANYAVSAHSAFSSRSKTPSRIAAATSAISADMDRSASTAAEILRTRA